MEQKSQNGLIVGALVIIVALGIIFVYAGNGKKVAMENAADNTATVSNTVAQPVAEDDPAKIAADINAATTGDLNADLQPIDDGLKNL